MRIISVYLNEPYDGRREYHFSSAALIYKHLPYDIVGIGLGSLYQAKCRQKCDEFETSKARIVFGEIIQSSRPANSRCREWLDKVPKK